MRFFIFILLSFAIHSVSLAATFQEKQFDPFLEKLIDPTSVKLLAAGTISVFATKPSDDSIRDQWVGHQKMSESTSHTGDILGSGLAGVLIASGQAVWDSDENHYQSHARALVYTTVVTTAMKYSFGRQRPGNSDSHQSFPSGHTSTSFATATSLTYAYGWKAAVVAYPVATFIGLSRLSDDAHWASDVVGGAFVGFIIARASSYSWSETDGHAQSNLDVYPDFRPDGAGFTINYNY